MGLLYVLLLTLLLLLTGTLGVVLGGLGWLLVAFLSLFIVYLWWQKLMLPFRQRSAIRVLRQNIEHKRSLGYETTELEIQLEQLRKELSPEYREMREQRRNMGYDD